MGESMSVRQGRHSPSESNDRCNMAQADRSFKEIYPGYRVIREDAITHPPDSDKKDRKDVSQAIRKALLVCNRGCMSSALEDIIQNLMAIKNEDTIITGDIIMSDRCNKEDADTGSEDQGCYLTNEPTGT